MTFNLKIKANHVANTYMILRSIFSSLYVSEWSRGSNLIERGEKVLFNSKSGSI